MGHAPPSRRPRRERHPAFADPVSRERDAYLRGDIDVYEFEERVAVALMQPVRTDPTIPARLLIRWPRSGTFDPYKD